MDRRVKERLVGAAILVALFVVVAPELLSGPKRAAVAPLTAPGGREPARTVTVDLATNKATSDTEPLEAADAGGGVTPGVAASDAAAPGVGVTESGAPTPAPGAAAPVADTARGADRGNALESAPSSPISTEASAGTAHHGWALQLGSFASRTKAEALAHRLKERGVSVYLVTSGSPHPLRYHVRVGPLADRATAERALVKFKAQGHAATVVPPA